MPGGVEVSLAGDVAVTVDGEPRVGRDSGHPLGPLAQVALAVLVLQRDRPTPREELAEILWGDDLPATWRSALRGLVSRLRTALEAAAPGPTAAIVNTAGSYQLRLPAEAVVDVEAAGEALTAARALLGGDGDPRLARGHARRAVALTTAAFLAGADGPWVDHHRAGVHATHVESLEALSQAAVACGDHPAALRAAEAAVSLEPVRESAHLRVMLAHLAAGNRGEAVRAYHRCHRVLADQLGVTPSPGTLAVCREMLADEGESPKEAGAPTPTNLPAAVDQFVDSDQAAAEVAHALAATRLLTLTGPPGIGKSRLAVEACRQLLDAYPDGVWHVDLAELTDGSGLTHKVCSVLGARPTPESSPVAVLGDTLGGGRTLLVLDNCEHVIREAATLTETLLHRSSALTVLATTREPLRIAGEARWQVRPLAAPPEGARTLADLWDFAAVRLFADRVRAVAADVALEHDPEAVARICRRLDGVPLALELAAAHTPALDLAEIASRLDGHLGFLAGPSATTPRRRRSVRAALAWSYDSLSPDAQQAFARFAVFPGEFGLAAAETVAALEDLGALESLVAKSLVLAERGEGVTRYRMLESVRQFAEEKLAASGQEPAVRKRHVAWAQRVAHAADEQLKGPAQHEGLARLDAEHHNLLVALTWAASAPGQQAAALSLALALWRFWELRGHLGEGRSWLEVLGARVDVPPGLRAQGLNAAAVLAHHQSDYATARRLYEDSLALRRRLADRAGVAASLNGLGHLAVSQGDFSTARRTFEENVGVASELDDRDLQAASVMNLAVAVQQLAAKSGSAEERATTTAEARVLHRQALDAYRALGDAHGTALCLENLGALECWEGHDEQAQEHLEESMAIRRNLIDRIGICGCGRFLGELALRRGDHAAARDYLDESLELARQLGSTQREAEALDCLARVTASPGDVGERRAPPSRRRARPLSVSTGRQRIADGAAPREQGHSVKRR